MTDYDDYDDYDDYYKKDDPVLKITCLGEVEIKNEKRYNKFELLLENYYMNIKEQFLFSFEDDIFAVYGFFNCDPVIDRNGTCYYQNYPFFYESKSFKDIICVMELYEATEIVIDLFKVAWEEALNRQAG
jgi:hypothetical protein